MSAGRVYPTVGRGHRAPQPHHWPAEPDSLKTACRGAHISLGSGAAVEDVPVRQRCTQPACRRLYAEHDAATSEATS